LLTGSTIGKLDKMTERAQAPFAYDSAASHTDPHLPDIAWRRENAVLALGTQPASPAHFRPGPTRAYPGRPPVRRQNKGQVTPAVLGPVFDPAGRFLASFQIIV
jgi:hypothetical protein